MAFIYSGAGRRLASGVAPRQLGVEENGQQGSASRAAARKQKDKWKAKRWYTIRAPRQPWHFKVIGETLGEEDQLLIGRMYEITQQEVDGDFSKMHVKLKFRVTEVKTPSQNLQGMRF